ncbi:glucoamylase S1-like [Daphnia pulex]|uniref:glucoamylase S1-like n=1 Tax=Daphnia pulex TaxID=6669 RepID=UPI001EDE4C28|nr:glucoamylase S1-like [Daphnia pulex]
MRFEVTCLLIFAIFCGYSSSTETPKTDQERFLLTTASITFTTFTLIKKTTTTTSTFTSVTTCTTSTSTLTTCTIGRRRRGLFYDDATSQGRSRRGLFYNDDEVQNKEGGTFLPVETKSSEPSLEVANTSIDESSLIPLEIESGFVVPEGSPNRFLLAFGTSTVTSVVITTSTSSLTAICSSTTGFPLCGNAGK